MSKYNWQCPKCGTKMSSDILDPKTKYPPECQDTVKHHNRRSYVMEVVNGSQQ